jgi:hypothetical protein
VRQYTWFFFLLSYEDMHKRILNYIEILYFTILYMEALSIIMYWRLAQVKTCDTTCLYAEVVDLK